MDLLGEKWVLDLDLVPISNKMADDDDNMLVACSAICIAAASTMLNLYISASESNTCKRKHRVWVSRYLRVRPQYGAYNSLMCDLLELDNSKFKSRSCELLNLHGLTFHIIAKIEITISHK